MSLVNVWLNPSLSPVIHSEKGEGPSTYVEQTTCSQPGIHGRSQRMVCRCGVHIIFIIHNSGIILYCDILCVYISCRIQLPDILGGLVRTMKQKFGKISSCWAINSYS